MKIQLKKPKRKNKKKDDLKVFETRRDKIRTYLWKVIFISNAKITYLILLE